MARRRMMASVVASLVVGLMALGGQAFADDLAKSKLLYRKGENAFAMGDYQHAAEYFEQAYEVSQRPQLLWNVAAAHRGWFDVDKDVAHLRRARTIYQNYASVIGVPNEVVEAQREIARVDAQIAAVVSGAATSPSPTTSTATATSTATGTAASTTAVTTAPVAGGDSGEGAVWKRWWLWTAVGVVVAGGVATGVVLGLRGAADDPTGLNAGVVQAKFP